MKILPRLVEVRQRVLKQNDLVAREMRRRFQEAGTFVVSLVSSPGSGKTAFLERTLSMVRENIARPLLLETLPPTTTPFVWRGATFQSNRSPPAPFAIWKPK